MDTLAYKSSMPDQFQVSTKHMLPGDVPCAVQLGVLHPLQESEKNSDQRKLNLQLDMLRQHGGIAAPLKLVMEIQASKKASHLPFLPSRNVHYQVLTGADETIDFNDYLGTSTADEFYQQPHAVMEKKLKF